MNAIPLLRGEPSRNGLFDACVQTFAGELGRVLFFHSHFELASVDPDAFWGEDFDPIVAGLSEVEGDLGEGPFGDEEIGTGMKNVPFFGFFFPDVNRDFVFFKGAGNL